MRTRCAGSTRNSHASAAGIRRRSGHHGTGRRKTDATEAGDVQAQVAPRYQNRRMERYRQEEYNAGRQIMQQGMRHAAGDMAICRLLIDQQN